MKKKETKKAAKKLIKEAAAHPGHYTDGDIQFAQIILNSLKKKEK